MSILQVAKRSFSLLLKQPKIFIPNLISAMLYAAYELILLFLLSDLFLKVLFQSAIDIQSLIAIAGVFFFYPFVGIVDLVTYGMYPTMIRDFLKDKRISLLSAFKASISSWKILLLLGIIFLAYLIFISIAILLINLTAILLNNLYLQLLALAISILVLTASILILMLCVFFLVPIGILERKSVLATIRKSWKLSQTYMREVFLINVLILLLVTFAIALNFLTPSIDMSVRNLTFLAILLFFLVKIFQAVVYTYIFTINPYFYLHHEKNRYLQQGGNF